MSAFEWRTSPTRAGANFGAIFLPSRRFRLSITSSSVELRPQATLNTSPETRFFGAAAASKFACTALSM